MRKFLLFTAFVFISFTVLKAQTAHEVQVSNDLFTPMNVNITVGDTVVWTWVAGVHTTTSDSTTGHNVWNGSINTTSQTFRFVITSPGVHHYHCTFHQVFGMVGTITATLPTGVIQENNSPAAFRLEQNYPNPFNPSTIISYTLNTPGFVSLKVYDATGAEVAALINENQATGAHSVVFNADRSANGGSLPSGVYFYRLKTGSVDQTRKMLLLK